ncbi:MAG: glycosyltransferase [Bacteroidales bacterium]|jgi:glycosyltransferase involved in cell wall biosynthesis|nr:glycosyltransferase [Bacteroidales bacterium]
MFSVVICTFNREDLIEKCLTHLAEQTDKEFEVIIVNNNSTDKTGEICQSFIEKHKELNFRIVLETKVGLCSARNRGLKEAKGDYVIYIDDDAFAHIDYISNLRNFINLYPHARVCGGKILPYFENKKPKWLSKYILPMVTTLDKGNKITFFKHRTFPVGANMIIHKEVFAKYGMFNEELGFKV